MRLGLQCSVGKLFRKVQALGGSDAIALKRVICYLSSTPLRYTTVLPKKVFSIEVYRDIG